MTRLAAGTTLVLLTLMAACERDATGRAVTAPDASGEVAAVAGSAASSLEDADDSQRLNVARLDDCDPADAAWNAVGGCFLRLGSVSLQVFNTELSS